MSKQFHHTVIDAANRLWGDLRNNAQSLDSERWTKRIRQTVITLVQTFASIAEKSQAEAAEATRRQKSAERKMRRINRDLAAAEQRRREWYVTVHDTGVLTDSP